jgi:lysyl endopeptidase
MGVRSPGAFGLRLHFQGCELGESSALVWAPAREGVIVRGPYSTSGPNGTGEFWTPYLPGDTAYVEVTGAAEPRLALAEIVHEDRRVEAMGQGEKDATWCHLDVMCYGSSQVDPRARDAVVQLNFVSGGNQYVCSGTILSTLDSTTLPYLLTAYHCLHTQSEVSSLEAVWFWQRASCGGVLPVYANLPRLIGGTLLESNPTSGGNDMTFIRLYGSLPAGATTAGWTTSYSDSSYGIHHPAGDWKRVTFFHDKPSPLSGCLFFDPTDYHFLKADDGFIEGGSSGSPLFDSAGRVMGQLNGMCCNLGHGVECQGIVCSSDRDDWRAVYGEFATTYPIIERWLAIGGTINVDGANVLGPWDGTPTHPFRTLSEAYSFAWDGTRMQIKTGRYYESLTLAKQLTVIADGGPVTIGP